MSSSFCGSSQFLFVPANPSYSTQKAHKKTPPCLDYSKAHPKPTPINDHTALSNYLKYYHNPASSSNEKLLIQARSPVIEDDREQDGKENELWSSMREEAFIESQQEPTLSSYYFSSILAHKSIEIALASHLSIKLGNPNISVNTLYDVFFGVLKEDLDVIEAVKDDLKAVKGKDPACMSYIHCFLNFKGFLACQAYRVSHKLWLKERRSLAVLIQNRVSEVFAVDIHPGAMIGRGVIFDHATGVVIGETVVVGDNVAIFHNVTLGGTGKVSGDRHPKIGDGVLIGAGTNALGNISVGEGAKIGAGSLVLKEVLPRTTAVGNPARSVAGKGSAS